VHRFEVHGASDKLLPALSLAMTGLAVPLSSRSYRRDFSESPGGDGDGMGMGPWAKLPYYNIEGWINIPLSMFIPWEIIMDKQSMGILYRRMMG